MFGPGTIQVRPNPVQAGGEVEITITGDPPVSFRFSNTGQGWQELEFPDGSKKAKVRVPPGAVSLFLTDFGDPPTSLTVEVVDLGR